MGATVVVVGLVNLASALIVNMRYRHGKRY